MAFLSPLASVLQFKRYEQSNARTSVFYLNIRSMCPPFCCTTYSRRRHYSINQSINHLSQAARPIKHKTTKQILHKTICMHSSVSLITVRVSWKDKAVDGVGLSSVCFHSIFWIDCIGQVKGQCPARTGVLMQ